MLPHYQEHKQFDAEECMTPIINCFDPQFNNKIPDDCLFMVESEESIYCLKCDKQSNHNFRERTCQIEFPDLTEEYSFETKLDQMTNDPYGRFMDNLLPLGD